MQQSLTTWAAVGPWWYTAVPGLLLRQQRLLLDTVADFFSFSILLKTLFQPWRRDELATDRLSLQERFQVWGLNLMARLFGFLMRSLALLAGLLSLLVLLLFFLFLWMVWLMAPIIGMLLIGIGLITILGGAQ